MLYMMYGTAGALSAAVSLDLRLLYGALSEYGNLP